MSVLSFPCAEQPCTSNRSWQWCHSSPSSFPSSCTIWGISFMCLQAQSSQTASASAHTAAQHTCSFADQRYLQFQRCHGAFASIPAGTRTTLRSWQVAQFPQAVGISKMSKAFSTWCTALNQLKTFSSPLLNNFFWWGPWLFRWIHYLLPVFFHCLPLLLYRWSVLKLCRHYQLEGSWILLKVNQREAVARCTEGIFSEAPAAHAQGPECDSALPLLLSTEIVQSPLVAKGEEKHFFTCLSPEEAPCPWCCTSPGAHIRWPPPPLTRPASPPDTDHI